MRQANPSIKRVVWTSFVVDLSDILLNFTVAIFSGSVVMLSQAIQGTADLTTSGLLLIGVNRSARRPNRQYQFGYGRDLFFWVLVAAVSMFALTGGLSFWLGLERFLDPHPIDNLAASILVLTIGLTTNLYAFSVSYRRLFSSKKTNFQDFLHSSRVETKTTLFLDAMGATASLFGLVSLSLLLITGDNRFDGLGAMIVGLTTASLAIFIMRDARSLIVGRAASPEDKAAIRQAALSIAGVRSVEDLRTMHIGSSQLLVNIEVNLDPKLHTRQIEEIMDQIKLKIKRTLPVVDHIQVELETSTKTRL